MFSFLRPRNYEHYVDHGCVHCPRSGFDVEVDACTGCEWSGLCRDIAGDGFAGTVLPAPQPGRLRA